jgi:2-keto-4-pentenoate hydratase
MSGPREVRRPGEDPRIVAGMTAQLARLDAALTGREGPLGWKLGFGSASAMAALGTDAPLVGHILPGARVASGAVVSIDGWPNPIAEPEIVLHLGADLEGDADRDTVIRAISGLGPAIELVDVHPPDEGVEEILAGDLYQRGVVFGPVDPSRAGGSTDGLAGRVRTPMQDVATDDVTALAGDPIDLIRRVAAVLARFGRRLQSGQVVITGSIVQPISVSPGDWIRFELEPIGAVEVVFGPV